MESYNAKLGAVLFAVYLTLYGGFVGINAFAPDQMDATWFAGLNLAVLYGVSLILFAFLLAMVYGLMCRDEPSPVSHRNDAPSASTNEKPN